VRPPVNAPARTPVIRTLTRAPGRALALVLPLTLTVALGAGLGGCSPERDSGPERSVTALPDPEHPDQGEPLSEELMLALSLAKNYHHKADVLAQEARMDESAEALRQILAIRFPADAPEAEDVRLDARARLAKLLAAQGRIDEAVRVVEEGLAGQPRRSFFLANLYTVKGEVHEAQAAALDQQGTDAARAAAHDARRAAIEAFDESIRINRALQEALLHEGGP
jgi:tetratricopeptide (TPR) repeat protein